MLCLVPGVVGDRVLAMGVSLACPHVFWCIFAFSVAEIVFGCACTPWLSPQLAVVSSLTYGVGNFLCCTGVSLLAMPSLMQGVLLVFHLSVTTSVRMFRHLDWTLATFSDLQMCHCVGLCQLVRCAECGLDLGTP